MQSHLSNQGTKKKLINQPTASPNSKQGGATFPNRHRRHKAQLGSSGSPKYSPVSQHPSSPVMAAGPTSTSGGDHRDGGHQPLGALNSINMWARVDDEANHKE